ncbi:MAG: DUF4271 domain-containing protein [Flavobacteriaceae bacterium]|nr:DUF4271 domain-containing protein [Flavobacteriaceae bacterium]
MLREVISNDFITILIVICITILTIVKFSFSKRFNDFSWIILNTNYLKLYYRDHKYLDNFNVFLFINQVINIIIFGYLIYITFEDNTTLNLVLFSNFILAFFALVFTKVLLDIFIGWLFDIKPIIKSYIFQKFNFKNYIGILLIPINIILVYAIRPSEKLIYAFLIALLLINLIGFLSSFKRYQKLLLSNIFYFILYLCALEIGPYIILYKLFN